MAATDMIPTMIEYHITMNGRVWSSIGQLNEQQFVADGNYSRGSIRNLMVHLAHTDLRWLTGLKNLPDPARNLKKFEEYPDRAAARAYSESVAAELKEFVHGLDEVRLNERPAAVPAPRWQVLLHLVNHGTDHRATVLQKLHDFGAPTFEQDFILWMWEKR
ncbi:MAG TPA: DinB family protein [Anaerolineales bacterium]